MKYKIWLIPLLLITISLLITSCGAISSSDCGYECDPRLDEAIDEYYENQSYDPGWNEGRYDDIETREERIDAQIEESMRSGEFDEYYSDNDSGCPYGCKSWKSGCNIKGNKSYNTGELIFHVPGQEFYNDTVIDPNRGERWFCTEQEAIAKGWRKAKR